MYSLLLLRIMFTRAIYNYTSSTEKNLNAAISIFLLREKLLYVTLSEP